MGLTDAQVSPAVQDPWAFTSSVCLKIWAGHLLGLASDIQKHPPIFHKRNSVLKLRVLLFFSWPLGS